MAHSSRASRRPSTPKRPQAQRRAGPASYVQQYCDVYNKRRRFTASWCGPVPPGVKVGRVVQAAEAKGDQRLVVLGTTFTACSNRPMIEGNRAPFGGRWRRLNLAAPDDEIVLEVESGRPVESRFETP